MTALYTIGFILFVIAIVALLGLTPEQIDEDVSLLFDKKETLKERALTARGKKKKSRIILEMERMRRALQETGKEKQFSVACTFALLLMVAGCIAAIAIDNMFLIPVLAIAFALIPFVYLAKTISIYETQVREEIETALSIITTSYVRNDNIISAVQENISYLKPPIKGMFESFLAETTVISPDIRQAIYHLKEKIKNGIFEEWCDTLISCQNDRTLKDMMAMFNIAQGIISQIMVSSGVSGTGEAYLPEGIISAIENCGFWESIPLWAVTLIGSLLVWVLSFVMILTVYGRFFRLYIYTAIAPVPMAAFAGEETSHIGKSFIKSFAAVCLEGAIIILACIIYSLFASSPPSVDTGVSAVTQVWTYIGELLFNMLVLVGTIKLSDRVVKEMMGL